MKPKKVMITGVYGLIGGAVYRKMIQSSERYEVYGLARRTQPSDRVAEADRIAVPDDRFVLSDLSDVDQLSEAFDGLDVVVHMAADPGSGGGWPSLLPNNVVGTYNILEASRRAGVERVVLASTIQVSSGNRREEPYCLIGSNRPGELPDDLPMVRADWPARPLNIYAATKVWGEAIARAYSGTHGLSCLCIRIGWVVAEDRPPTANAADMWCSQRDIVELIECCVNAPESVRYDIFYGMSDNKDRWVDIEHAREKVGYVAQDRAEEHTPGDR